MPCLAGSKRHRTLAASQQAWFPRYFHKCPWGLHICLISKMRPCSTWTPFQVPPQMVKNIIKRNRWQLFRIIYLLTNLLLKHENRKPWYLHFILSVVNVALYTADLWTTRGLGSASPSNQNSACNLTPPKLKLFCMCMRMVLGALWISNLWTHKWYRSMHTVGSLHPSTPNLW